jgi:hypothetical protein
VDLIIWVRTSLFDISPDTKTTTTTTGEARGWPQNTKCRGTIADVAGFEKETAWWFRSWWLSNISSSDAGRPNITTDTTTTVRILDSWRAIPGTKTRTMSVYTNAPRVDIYIDNRFVQTQEVPYFGMATFTNVTFVSNSNFTAVAKDERNHVLGSHTVYTSQLPSSVRLSVDVPSTLTGTGEYLVLDGEDVAMLRATILDENNFTVSIESDVNVTFEILSGPGHVLATHNGNPSNLSPSHAPWTMTYGGLARCFVRVTTDAASLSRDRIVEIDAEPEPNIRVIRTNSSSSSIDNNIVVGVQATLPNSNGKTIRSTVEIPVSTDMSHAVRNLNFY